MDISPTVSELLDRYNVSPRDVVISLCVSHQLVSMWRSGVRNVSAPCARELEAKFNIPKHLLRPDIWDAPAEKRAAHRPLANA